MAKAAGRGSRRPGPRVEPAELDRGLRRHRQRRRPRRPGDQPQHHPVAAENDGTGHFTDITAGSGLFLTGFFLQAKLADFDNDGHLDCLTSGGTGAQYFLLGNGDGTFTELDWPQGRVRPSDSQ